MGLLLPLSEIFRRQEVSDRYGDTGSAAVARQCMDPRRAEETDLRTRAYTDCSLLREYPRAVIFVIFVSGGGGGGVGLALERFAIYNGGWGFYRL